MQAYPHTYRVQARGVASEAVIVAAPGLPDIVTAPPPEFDGPGGSWSPETLLIGAVADCFVLSFRAVARAARFEWQSLECQVEGVLEKLDGITQFTRLRTHATLRAASGNDAGRAQLLLEKAERVCLIGNSLKATKELDCQIVIGTSSA